MTTNEHASMGQHVSFQALVIDALHKTAAFGQERRIEVCLSQVNNEVALRSAARRQRLHNDASAELVYTEEAGGQEPKAVFKACPSADVATNSFRSEERRVGKECRSR